MVEVGWAGGRAGRRWSGSQRPSRWPARI